MYEIFHDYPIPEDPPAWLRKSPGRSSIYPFDKMKPGDSFLIPAPITPSKRTVCFSAARSRGLKIRTKAVPGGLRVWLLDTWTPAKRLQFIYHLASSSFGDPPALVREFHESIHTGKNAVDVWKLWRSRWLAVQKLVQMNDADLQAIRHFSDTTWLAELTRRVDERPDLHVRVVHTDTDGVPLEDEDPLFLSSTNEDQ